MSDLRSQLQELNKPTFGTRAELEAAYEMAMREQRLKGESWDSTTQTWVPSSKSA